MERGILVGFEPTAPDSYTILRLGAWSFLAKFAARFGMPTPTRTDSRSLSSRAATITINSLGVTSVILHTSSQSPVVDRRAVRSPGLQFEYRFGGHLLHVRSPVLRAE